MILFGEGAFADEIKLGWGSYEKTEIGHRDTQEKGHVKTEAETVMMLP